MNSSRIRTIRRDKNLSGTRVAAQLGITPQYYYDIEKGLRNLSADMALSLAKLFDVSVDYLLARTEVTGNSETESLQQIEIDATTDLTVFAKRLSVEMSKKELTVDRVAEFIERTPDFVKNMLDKPSKLPAFGTLQKLAEITGVTSDYLCGYTSDPRGYAQGVQSSDSIDLKEFVTKNRVLNYGGDKMELDDEEQAEIDDFLRVAWMTVKQKRREKAKRGNSRIDKPE